MLAELNFQKLGCHFYLTNYQAKTAIAFMEDLHLDDKRIEKAEGIQRYVK